MSRIKFYCFVLCCLIGIIQVRAFATLDLELTQGVEGARPIAIVPFALPEGPHTAISKLSDIVRSDLQHSGLFNILNTLKMTQFPHQPTQVNFSYWRELAVDNLLIGQIEKEGHDRYKISYALVDVFKNATNDHYNPVLFSQTFTIKEDKTRRLAHHISDQIYKKLTGEKGVFSTRLAYILVQRASNQPTKYILEIADADGQNPRPILISQDPIMSPAWSPDGERLAYVSFEGKASKIFVANIRTGQRTRVASYAGINGAPAWSPDGKKLAFVLSKSGAPKIYILNLATRQLRQMTDGLSIDTEPQWSPDGRSLVFTSNRGGTPQIYKVVIRSKKTRRLTFAGNYNASPSFTPDGQSIVMLHREDRLFTIAVLDIATGALRTLTHSGLDESPSVAPNGKMVIYASHYGTRGVLALVSLDGRIKLRLPARVGDVQAPSWSPYLA